MNAAVQALGYATKPSTALQLRSYDVKDLPFVVISSVKRPTIGWISTRQGASTRLCRLTRVSKNDLTVTAPETDGDEDNFKDAILATFQGINYTTFANTPAWNSTVIDDDDFDTSKLPIGYSYNAILVVVDCLEVTTVG
jgi:hypothetical protein